MRLRQEKSTTEFCLSVLLRPRARLDLEAFVDEELLRLFDMTSSLELPVELDLDDLVALPEPERAPFLRVRFGRPLPFFCFVFYLTKPSWGRVRQLELAGAKRLAEVRVRWPSFFFRSPI